MLPTSQQIQRKTRGAQDDAALLAGAFSDFIAASSRLEMSYRDLQAEVADLSQALVERNQALSASLSETQSIGQRLQRVLEIIPCGVVVLGEGGTLLLANAEAMRLLELCERDPRLLQLLGPSNALSQEAASEQEFSIGEGEQQLWIAVRRASKGGLASLEESLNAEAVWTLRDISARKRMEAERERVRDTMALAQVAAVLAHEIRNPLASLELFAGLIADHPEQQARWLSYLRAGIRTLSGTVNNVLTLQSPSALSLEAVDLCTECALAISFMQPLAEQSGVGLTFTSDLNEIRAWANRSALHQILMNLCSNALRHTSTDGFVQVTCREPATPQGALLISVTDNGSGILPEHLPHLFEPGFSGSGVTSGLGLAVCNRLVQQMGGFVRVHSKVGQGSTFVVELAQA